MICRLVLLIIAVFSGTPAALAQRPATFGDNGDSVAVVVGNRNYKQTVSVDYAHNDADAIKEYLVRFAGFAESNVRVTKDGTLSEMTQVFGSERNPRGWLWQNVREHRSNVFVYFSGHGIPDLQTKEPALLPVDGDPNNIDTGFRLDILYRNLEQVKQRIGPEHELVVMIDACFTGETGRKGESLLAISAPGFAPARPKSGGGIVRVVASSGSQPANWDPAARLGLLTSKFLTGVAGLARTASAEASQPVAWEDLAAYIRNEVPGAARQLTGRDQSPEIDTASILLRSGTVAQVAGIMATKEDEQAWRASQAAGAQAALEEYVAHCNSVCAHRDDAMGQLFAARRTEQANTDDDNWRRLSKDGRYRDYLNSCEPPCAFRQLAEKYLSSGTGVPPPSPASPPAKSPPGNPGRPPSGQAATLLERGNELAGKGNDDLAIRAYSQAIAADPRSARAYIARGEAYRRKRSFPEALRDFNKAVELDATSANAFYGRGLVYTLQGDHARAGQDYDAAIRLNPADASALNNRCWTRAVTGQLAFAMEDCNAALQLRPDFTDAFESRGLTYLKLGEFDHAIADYDTALNAVPRNADALYGRGIARRRQGDAAGANTDIAAARAIRGDIAQEFSRRGVQ